MINDINKIVQIVNNILSDQELEIVHELTVPRKPVFFIVGPPRAGTTVLLQTMINYYRIAYINNFIAKFWDAPVIGAILYSSLGLKVNPQSYTSDSGFTEGIDGPHEFGYFWKRFFRYKETHVIDEVEYETIDHPLLNKEIAGLEHVLKRPMIFKNPPALSPQINFLYRYIPNSYFIYIKREPSFVAQSIYLKRKEIFNDIHRWYSVKPAEYSQLKSEEPITQIAGQVYHTSRKIEQDLSQVPDDRKIIMDYHDFCINPVRCINKCTELADLMIPELKDEAMSLKFKIKNEVLLDADTWTKINQEINKLRKV